MRKRGIVLNNVLGIILAVLGILIFVGGIYKIYQVGVNEESENAKKTLDIVLARVEAMPDGQSGTFTVQGFSENAWFLMGWSASDAKPDKCLVSSCVCICKGNRADECQNEGFCRKVDFPNVTVESASLESPTSGGVSAGSGAPASPGSSRIIIKNCFPIIDSLQEINLFVKRGETLRISGEAARESEPGAPWVFTSASSCEDKA